MYRPFALLGLLIVVTASQADDLPVPRKLDEAGPLGGPALVDKPASGANSSVIELRTEIAKLQAAREALQLERTAAAQVVQTTEPSKAEQIGQLQQRLKAALKQMEESRKKQPKKVTPQPVKPISPPPDNGTGPILLPNIKPDLPPQPMATGPVDALALGPVLFQTGDYEGALTAFHLLNLDGLGTQDRLTVMYMTAACLRKLGKSEDAAALFREVANSKGDDLLVECAQWQLSAIRWRRDVESKLEEMRQRRKALETKA